MGKFKNLQKLDLSFNCLKGLPSGDVFRQMKNLKILYLHDNLIANWSDLVNVCQTPSLIHLTLNRNPISQIPGYRHQLANQMKHLKALDDFIVTDEERIDFTSPNALRFRALSQNYMKIYLPKFLENQSADQHLFNLEVDIYRIKRLYERNSPSIRIQSLYRGYTYRSKAIFSYSQKKQAAIKIQKIARGWLYRLRIKKELRAILKNSDMDYLLMTQQDYKKFKAVKKITLAVIKWLRRRRKQKLLNYSATMVQKLWRGKHNKTVSFMKALKINSQGNNSCNIFFLKEQKGEFIKILEETLNNSRLLKQYEYQLEDMKQLIENDNSYQIIRYPNPLTFKRHEFPILQLSSPSFQCRVKVNQGMSKLIKNGQHVHNLATRFIGMDREKDILEKKLKKRLCNFNSQDTCYIFETRQNRMQSLKMRKIYDNYQELLVFKSPNYQVTQEICKEICKNNSEIINENFLAFFPSLLETVSAAMKIQQSYRSYLIRKEQKQLLQQKKKHLIKPPIEACFAEALIQFRAVNCISQWWKYHKLKRRLEALSSINNFLKTIQSPTLYLEEQIYLNFQQILENLSQRSRFLEQQANFDFMLSTYSSQSAYQQIQLQPLQIGLSQPLRKTISHRDATNTLNASGNTSQNIQEHEQIHSQREIIEKYFQVNIENTSVLTDRYKSYYGNSFPLWITNQHQLYYNNDSKIKVVSEFFNQYLGIVHKASIDSLCKIKDYNEIVGPYEKKLNLNYGLRFVEIQCTNIQEAKRRALLVAALSYNVKDKSFIRLYSQSNLANGIFLKNLYQLWANYKLVNQEKRMIELFAKTPTQITAAEIQIIRDKQRKQIHQGLILSKRDRWSIEGCSHLKFQEVEKPKSELPSNMTMRQRNIEITHKEYNFIQSHEEDEQVKIEINLAQNIIESATPHSDQQNADTSKASQHIAQYQKKSNHNHISSKEPVSTLKNISLKDIQSVQFSKQFNVQSPNDQMWQFINPSSVKSGTAWPSTRYQKQILDSNQQMTFFNFRKSSNAPSTQMNSQDQTPTNANQLPLKNSSLPYSAFRQISTRPHSLDQSAISLIIGDPENQRLLDLQKQEEEQTRERLKQTQHYEKLGRKFEVAKLKQINSLMKQIVKVEQEANIQMYKRFNKQEKELIGELKIKEQERIDAEQREKRKRVQMHHENKRRKSEDRVFAKEFTQMSNMITKQSMLGLILKQKNKSKRDNQSLVKEIRGQENEVIKNKNSGYGYGTNESKILKPLISKVFDSQIPESKHQKYRVIPMTAINSPRQTLIENTRPYITSSYNLIDISKQRYHEDSMTSKPLTNIESQFSKQGLFKHKQLNKLTFIEEQYPIHKNSSKYLTNQKQL